jgi:hypothetical protein
VTSVNTMGPEGREGCTEEEGGGAGEVCVDGTGVDAGADEAVCCSVGDSFLHPDKPTNEDRSKHATHRRDLKTMSRSPTITAPPSISLRRCGASRAKSRPA